MNWKLVIVGGLVFYAVTFVVSFGTGAVIHGKILAASYDATPSFWRPELNQEPPDMGALMPLWITTGLLTSFVIARLFCWIRPAMGRGWLGGVKFGSLVTILGWVFIAGFSGVFNLPIKIWIWWGIEQPFYYVTAGAVLGWLGEKLAPSD